MGIAYNLHIMIILCTLVGAAINGGKGAPEVGPGGKGGTGEVHASPCSVFVGTVTELVSSHAHKGVFVSGILQSPKLYRMWCLHRVDVAQATGDGPART